MLDEEGKCIYIERRIIEDTYEEGYEKEEWTDVDEKFLYE